jgi:YD repeat-containing protein
LAINADRNGSVATYDEDGNLTSETNSLGSMSTSVSDSAD